MHDEAIYAERALRARANGYIMKQEATEKVLVAVGGFLTAMCISATDVEEDAAAIYRWISFLLQSRIAIAGRTGSWRFRGIGEGRETGRLQRNSV